MKRAVLFFCVVLTAPSSWGAPKNPTESCVELLHADSTSLEAIQTGLNLLRTLVPTWIRTPSFFRWAEKGDWRTLPISELGIEGPILQEAFSLIPVPLHTFSAWHQALLELSYALSEVMIEEIPPPAAIHKHGIPTSVLALANGGFQLGGLYERYSPEKKQIWFAQITPPWRQSWQSTFETRELTRGVWNKIKEVTGFSITSRFWVIENMTLSPAHSGEWATAENTHELRWADEMGKEHRVTLPFEYRDARALRFSRDGNMLYFFCTRATKKSDQTEEVIVGVARRTHRVQFVKSLAGSLSGSGYEIQHKILGSGEAADSLLFFEGARDAHKRPELREINPQGELRTKRSDLLFTKHLFEPARAISPNGQFMAEGATSIQIWATSEKSNQWDTELQTESSRFSVDLIEGLAFSADSKYLACLRRSGALEVWDWATQSLVYTTHLLTEKDRISRNSLYHQTIHLTWGFEEPSGAHPLLVVAGIVSNVLIPKEEVQYRAWRIRVAPGGIE